MTTPKPIVISTGDPSGIGPEVYETAFQNGSWNRPLVFLGDPRTLSDGFQPNLISDISEAVTPETAYVLPYEFPALVTPGEPHPENAAAIIASIQACAELSMAGKAAGMVTAPINKLSVHQGAGFSFPGHTEFLAHLAGDIPVAMMLACPELRVVPLTIHIALSDVPKAITRQAVIDGCRLVHKALQTGFGIAAPRLAVAGLNPHAGEGGRMGMEDIKEIIPAISALKEDGMDVTGPWPADTMFHAGARQTYDVAICMYHDQALIPIKTIDFAGGVNVTLGLPFVRTSPDHGTAYDIAGKGIADPSSMMAAISLACDMADRRGD